MIENTCTICDELQGISHPTQGEYAVIVESGHHILAEIGDIVCIPSLGPLTPSHVMLAPRSHVKNVASLSAVNSAEIRFLKSALSSFNEERFRKPTTFFEHGTGNATDVSCACVEHAHLHAISTEIDLTPLLLEHYAFYPLPSMDLKDEVVDSGYYYYQHGNNTPIICTQALEPQFFRIMHWRALRSWSPWNWRLFHNVGLVREVIRNYEQFASTLQV